MTGLVIFSALAVGLTAPDNGREALDYLTLIADLEKGTQLFFLMGEALYAGDVGTAAKFAEPGGDIEQYLTFCMSRWSLRDQRTGAPTTEVGPYRLVHAICAAKDAACRVGLLLHVHGLCWDSERC